MDDDFLDYYDNSEEDAPVDEPNRIPIATSIIPLERLIQIHGGNTSAAVYWYNKQFEELKERRFI